LKPLPPVRVQKLQSTISAAVWRLVTEQHGVVARRQLLTVGLSRRQIDQRIANGRLHPVHRGVYAVGRPGLTREGLWMAAVLACGPGAVLSHGSAAALWGIRKPVARIDVTVPAQVTRTRPGITVHRRALSEADTTTRRGIPVSAVVLTLTDLAAQLDRDSLEAAIGEADKRDLMDPDRLRAALTGCRKRPGLAILKRTLDRRTFRLTDSQLERLFLRIVRRVGLEPPETRHHQSGFRIDFFWPGLGLVVETDGLRYHRTPAQQTRDRLRDQRHTVAGVVPLRFTHEQIRYEPSHVEATLQAVAARLRARIAA
jgi:very-short-patch-repair endonuclease